jgi:hypothetical protein
MNWEAVTAISTAFTGLIIAVTALVGVYQLRQLRQQRRDAGTIELVRTFQDTDFTRAGRLVFSLPPGLLAADLRAYGREYEEAAQILALRFEYLGVLVYRGSSSATAYSVAQPTCGIAMTGFQITRRSRFGRFVLPRRSC